MSNMEGYRQAYADTAMLSRPHVAWQVVDERFARGTEDCAGLYEGETARMLADYLRLDRRITNQDAVRVVEFEYLGTSSYRRPNVVLASDRFVESLAIIGEPVQEAVDELGQDARRLVRMNATGKGELEEQLGCRDIMIDSQSLSPPEKSAQQLWGLSPSAHMPSQCQEEAQCFGWVARVLPLRPEDSAMLLSDIRETGPITHDVLVRPMPELPMILQAYVDETTKVVRSNGSSYKEHQTTLDTFARHMGVMYMKAADKFVPSDHIGQFEKLVMSFRHNINYLYNLQRRELAGQDGINIAALDQQAREFGLQLDAAFRGFIARDELAGHSVAGPAILLPLEAVASLTMTMSQGTAEVIAHGEGEESFACVWYGARHLLTFVPSSIPEHIWMHVDTLHELAISDEELPAYRERFIKIIQNGSL